MARTMAFTGVGILLLHECDACGSTQTRVFTDSWTGKELCLECLSIVARHITMSPDDEGDNLEEVLSLHIDSGEADDEDDES